MPTKTRGKSIQAALLLLTILPNTSYSDTTNDALTARMQRLQHLIALNERYKLTFDATFPCSVTLFESYTSGDAQWVKENRLNLEDMETGSHFVARDNRRKIIYSSTSTDVSGDRRVFTPKRVNNISYSLEGYADNAESQKLIDQLIFECRDRNDF